MTEFLQWQSHLPQIPEELLTYDINDIINIPNRFGAKNGIYSTHDVSSELYDFLRPHLGDDIQVRYQLFKSQIPVHIDAHTAIGVSYVYNYVLLTGGENIRTRHWRVPNKERLIFRKDIHPTIIWGDELNNKQLLNEVILPAKRWHRLAVNIPHDISKIDSPRLGITVSNTKGD